ncbi:MAG: RNB domain-containing ribonuclease [Desulfobacterales bacterium]|nr:RNB domain-containing ribonuclease [Desulfobacterales bacterium]
MKLHLLTPANREVNLSPKRAILISESSIDTQKPREALLDRLKQIEESRNRLKDRIDVKELWDLVIDEKESFDHKYLAQLVFGQATTDDHQSAMGRALFEDRLHFKLKDGYFLANSAEKIERLVKQREEEAQKEERLRQGSIWLKEVRKGKRPEDPPFKKDIIDLLMQLALYGNDAPDFKPGKELLSRSGISDIREAKDLLISLGIWEEDENLELLHLGLATSFHEKQVDEAIRLSGVKTGFENREDLRGLPTITIDSSQTRDYDDAVSLEMEGDILHLGIHIADVSEVILPDSILDREAMERASSLYLPRRHIPMIPTELSQDCLSLKQGCDRAAISLLARFDKNGGLLDYRFVPSVISVKQRLSYEEVNETLNSEETSANEGTLREGDHVERFQEMYKICRHMRRKRMNRDALNLSLPDLHVEFNPDSSISLRLVDQNTPARMIIAEFMILYNWLVAGFCKANRIPILFRSQAEPSERLSMEEEGYYYYVFKQRRKLSRLHVDTSPRSHSGLGLEIYTQCTSPIRRYIDLVTQRQLKCFLMEKETIYDKKNLKDHQLYVAPVLRDLQKVQRSRLRYWTLKYLSQHLNKKYKALILDELKNRFRVVLTDFLLVAEIRWRNGMIVGPGEEIMVGVKKADPWNDVLELVHAD